MPSNSDIEYLFAPPANYSRDNMLACTFTLADGSTTQIPPECLLDNSDGTWPQRDLNYDGTFVDTLVIKVEGFADNQAGVQAASDG